MGSMARSALARSDTDRITSPGPLLLPSPLLLPPPLLPPGAVAGGASCRSRLRDMVTWGPKDSSPSAATGSTPLAESVPPAAASPPPPAPCLFPVHAPASEPGTMGPAVTRASPAAPMATASAARRSMGGAWGRRRLPQCMRAVVAAAGLCCTHPVPLHAAAPGAGAPGWLLLLTELAWPCCCPFLRCTAPAPCWGLLCCHVMLLAFEKVSLLAAL